MSMERQLLTTSLEIFALFHVTLKLISQQLSMNFKKANAYIYKTSSYKCSCIC